MTKSPSTPCYQSPVANKLRMMRNSSTQKIRHENGTPKPKSSFGDFTKYSQKQEKVNEINERMRKAELRKSVYEKTK